ncbi:jg14794 [Pararge aegeria aegeria]|uniref:Jg14794 protein n=1 Tax=Pararge aegeria aegeria TaxID=348720 RepID=A0A8S4QUY7_9NEOP|nr:jg14794 [Pararge aegeria aegeria]
MELIQLIFERDLSLNSIQRMADCIDNEAEFRSRELNNIKKQFHSVQSKIEKHLAKKVILDFLEKELAALEVMSAAKHSARLTTMSDTSRQPTSVTRSGTSPAYADSST